MATATWQARGMHSACCIGGSGLVELLQTWQALDSFYLLFQTRVVESGVSSFNGRAGSRGFAGHDGVYEFQSEAPRSLNTCICRTSGRREKHPKISGRCCRG